MLLMIGLPLSYCVSIDINLWQFLCFCFLNFILDYKVIYTPTLSYCSTLFSPKYLPLPFIFLYGFVVLFIVLQLEGFSLAFCRVGKMVMNSLNFCFLQEILNFSFVFEEQFSNIQYSWLAFFFFQCFKQIPAASQPTRFPLRNLPTV